MTQIILKQMLDCAKLLWNNAGRSAAGCLPRRLRLVWVLARGIV